ncbi:hypothetical protein NJ7G_3537 [Natrinema sp. J7-2]|nr:hypothetical protein NJ7G_3537 [Natrinema sp. J7-2]
MAQYAIGRLREKRQRPPMPNATPVGGRRQKQYRSPHRPVGNALTDTTAGGVERDAYDAGSAFSRQ